MLDLSPKQIGILQRCAAAGFSIVAFPVYASAVGIKKGNCAALLKPGNADRMTLFGDPCYLVDGNLSVKVRRHGSDWFIWKKKQLAVTSERLDELAKFRSDLDSIISRGV
jgi:hypothetical protein